MKRVFVDTSTFFAHLVAEDAHHAEARRLFERASRESWTLVTTNAAVWENYTLLRVRARNGRELLIHLRQKLRAPCHLAVPFKARQRLLLHPIDLTQWDTALYLAGKSECP